MSLNPNTIKQSASILKTENFPLAYTIAVKLSSLRQLGRFLWILSGMELKYIYYGRLGFLALASLTGNDHSEQCSSILWPWLVLTDIFAHLSQRLGMSYTWIFTTCHLSVHRPQLWTSPLKLLGQFCSNFMSWCGAFYIRGIGFFYKW